MHFDIISKYGGVFLGGGDLKKIYKLCCHSLVLKSSERGTNPLQEFFKDILGMVTNNQVNLEKVCSLNIEQRRLLQLKS